MPFPITAEEIAKTESKLGLTFPLGFKARMIRDNGGEIKAADDYWQLIPFFDTSDKKRLARTCNDIVRETKSASEQPGFPEGAVVVADNGTGDLLLLVPTETDSKALGEEIYFWNHETRETELVSASIQEL
jgi:hypothetical protein